MISNTIHQPGSCLHVHDNIIHRTVQSKIFINFLQSSSFRAHQNNQSLASFTYGAPLSLLEVTVEQKSLFSQHPTISLDTQQNETTTLGLVIPKLFWNKRCREQYISIGLIQTFIVGFNKNSSHSHLINLLREDRGATPYPTKPQLLMQSILD